MTPLSRTPEDLSPSRRRDARANRERLLTEARALIAEHGIEASLEEIARRAEVGVATLYRNFPARDDLIRALHATSLADLLPVREEIEAAPTAWDGVVVYLERVVEWLVADPALPPILKRMGDIDPGLRSEGRFEAFIAELVEQAKQEGELRNDVYAVDLAVLITLIGSLGSLGDGYAGQWRRQLSIALDGLRAPGHERAKLPGRPLNVKQFQASMHGLSRRSRRRAT